MVLHIMEEENKDPDDDNKSTLTEHPPLARLGLEDKDGEKLWGVPGLWRGGGAASLASLMTVYDLAHSRCL